MKRKKWYWILLLGLSILLVGSVLACVSERGSTPTAQPPPTEQPEKKPAQFKVSALTVKPAAVMVGFPTTVTATVTNSGDISGAYEASLVIDDEEIDRKVAWVDSGVPKEVSFQVTKTTAGSYKLRVGELSAVLDVYDWTPQTIQYDSGIYDPVGMGTYMWEGWGQIVHFTPLTKPYKIQEISISAFAQVKNYADLPKRMFTVRIWNENKTQQLWSHDFSWNLFQSMGWQDIDVPDIITEGDFHVEVVTNSDAPPSNNLMALNYEISKDEVRSGVSYMGQVAASEKYAVKDKLWFIRVKGAGPATTLVQEEEQNEAEASSAKLVYEDDFNDSSSGWPVESTKNDDWYYEDGEYHGLVKNSNWVSWWFSPSSGVLTDFILEADGRLVSGPKDCRYGVCFRSQNQDNFYRFLVSGNGYYYIGTRTNGQWTTLASWAKSSLIETGNSTNHLKVICKGSKIAVYANGHLLTTITDESFSEGRVGVIVDTIELNAHVAFDNLKVYSSD